MFNDLFSSIRGARTTVPNISGEEFHRLMQEHANAVVLDVRTPGEFHAGHIPGAINLDMMDFDFAEKVQSYEKSAPVLLYCRSGNRSYHAGNVMMKLGFAKVYNLASGLFDWQHPLER
ncbi:MAG: rhodanese-like domain-containing protein [Bacteroidetes bacterium]|nr:rhodanese-like domain-containing protein [Bacteroidota bacterium]